MIRSVVQIDLASDFVLNDATVDLGHTLTITRGELHDDGALTFVANVPADQNEFAERLRNSDAVTRVGTVGENGLHVRKRSSGAVPIIYRNEGILEQIEAYGTNREIEFFTFTKEDLSRIVTEFKELGSTRIRRVTQVTDQPSGLSDRQQEVLEVALNMGYFEWPRQADSTEVAEELGISRPTFSEHLRKAQQKVLEHVVSTTPLKSSDEF